MASWVAYMRDQESPRSNYLGMAFAYLFGILDVPLAP